MSCRPISETATTRNLVLKKCGEPHAMWIESNQWLIDSPAAIELWASTQLFMSWIPAKSVSCFVDTSTNFSYAAFLRSQTVDGIWETFPKQHLTFSKLLKLVNVSTTCKIALLRMQKGSMESSRPNLPSSSESESLNRYGLVPCFWQLDRHLNSWRIC